VQYIILSAQSSRYINSHIYVSWNTSSDIESSWGEKLAQGPAVNELRWSNRQDWGYYVFDFNFFYNCVFKLLSLNHKRQIQNLNKEGLFSKIL
jgi:hypothetical protein